MRIAMSGSTGFIGTALRRHLAGLGHDVVPMVRRAPGPGEIGWDPRAGRLDRSAFAGVDAVVNLAGAGIGDRRWSADYRREIRESRTRATNLIAEVIAASADGPQVLLSASGIDYYGDRGDEVLDEEAGPGEGFLAEVVQAWEASTAAAEAAGARVVHLRSGIVLGRDGGALPRMVTPFRFGVGGRFGSGRQWQSWISLPDEVAAVTHLLTSARRGAVNLTAPRPVRNDELASTLGAIVRRPSLLPAPAFALKLALGTERAEALLLESKRVVPGALQADGFSFAHPDLTTALRAVLGR